ncbi:DUF1176 domain-containing protein [Brevundimonas basaltis]|nr:DUF1176 domain-containing protein [Brevundimonas basaltis]
MICSITIAALLAVCGGGSGAAGGVADATSPAPQTRPPPVNATPEVRTFRDWRVACDNSGDCIALTGGDIGAAAFVRLRMPAGPDAEPEVVAGAWGLETAERFELSIDGAAHRLTMTPLSEWAGIAGTRGTPARALITAMGAGRDLVLSIDDSSGSLSLAGVSAALLWIDERQGRLGTVTALLRRGDHPATNVPPPAMLPEIDARPASISQFTRDNPPPLPDSVASRPEIKTCREDWGYAGADEDGLLYAELGPETRLWGLRCFLAAYNTGHVLFLTDHLGGGVRPLTLAGLDETIEVFTNVLPGYTLTNTVRARGLGDCGVIQQWRWARRGFELALEKRMDECWGLPPELWPTLWRTRGIVPWQAQAQPVLNPVETAAPAERLFGHWGAACNNRRDCFAWNTQPDSGSWIRIAMAADADAAPEVLAGTIRSTPGAGYEVHVDGARYPLDLSTELMREGLGRLHGQAARRLITALADARSVDVSNGAASGPVPVEGLVRALQWIDRSQGRSDTPTALSDRGDQPSTAIPAVPALPAIRPAPAVDQAGFGVGSALPATVSAMPDLVACKAEWGETYRPLKVISARLTAETELWGAPCSLTTFNAGYLLYLTGPGGRDPVRLKLRGALEETSRFVNPAYDADTRTLSQTEWGNKWGHCGRAQSWIWTNDGFQLQSETAMTSCNALYPPIWPSLWSSR